MELEPGIYVEIKEALGNEKYGWHAYLVYRKRDGTSEVLRGGPGPFPRNLMSIVGGDIAVESGKSLKDSADTYGEGETPESRFTNKLPIPEDKLDEKWGVMRKRVEKIGKSEIDYNASEGSLGKSQTSNSVIRAALKAAEVPIEKAIHPDFREELKGIENDLSSPIDETFFEKSLIEIEKNSEVIRNGKNKGTGKKNSDDGEGSNSPKDKRNGLPDQQGALSGPGNPGIYAFLTELKKPLDPEDEFLIKPVAQISGGEMKRVMAGETYHNGGDMRRGALLDKAGAWHDLFYGNDPVKRDATGRQIAPRPVRSILKESAPVRDAKGGDVTQGVLEIGSQVAGMAGRAGIADAIRALQSGLNKLPRTTPPIIEQPERPHREGTIFSAVPLREDGLFGPKTKHRLFESVAIYGRRRIGAEFGVTPFARTG